ncbi:554_t:CDS:2, partial [Racocetra persica]
SGRIIKEAQRRLSRKYYSRQVANNLVKKHDSIAVEDLNVKSMLKKKLGDGKRSLRRSLLEVKFGILLKVIAEAAEIATRQFVPVESKNTSQICSDCGELLKDKLELNQRTF